MHELKGEHGILRKLDKYYIDIFNAHTAIDHLKDDTGSNIDSINQ